MGSCFSFDSKDKEGTVIESSNGTAKIVQDSPKRHAERGKDGLKETLLKSSGKAVAAAAEDMSKRCRTHPGPGESEPRGRGTSRDKPAMSHSNPTAHSASPPKKNRKQEGKSERKPSRKAKEVPLIVDSAKAAEADLEQGGGEQATRVEEMGPLEAEPREKVDKMEVVKTEVDKMKVVKTEVDKMEVVKTEVDKMEVVKTEVDKMEMVNKEMYKMEVAKPEVDKIEVVKTEVDKMEVVKTEVDKMEMVNTEMDKMEVAKTEVDKMEVVKTEAGKMEAVKTEVNKMEVSAEPEPPPEPHLEPAPPTAPPHTEEKVEPVEGKGGATDKAEAVEEEEEEEDDIEDMYRGEEEIEEAKKKSQKKNKKGPLEPVTVQDRAAEGSSSSVEDVVNLLHYSQREWRGNTPKSALIRKGYKDLSQSFIGLRRVRGDNYCALRATLFQVLAQSTELPSWLSEEDVTQWPEQLLTKEELVGQWQFPTGRGEEQPPEAAIEQLKHYMRLLRTRWEAAAQAGSAQERQSVCEEVFRAQEEEYGLLEVLKFLMLRTACELYKHMCSDSEVPVFCYLLFARDTSSCPRDFLLNHLRHVGVSGGLEQVEMFLLGYALQQRIQVYRLYKVDTEEFITYYPDDHKDWPCVCLLTEDDRHYNVPVPEVVGLQVPGAPTLV